MPYGSTALHRSKIKITNRVWPAALELQNTIPDTVQYKYRIKQFNYAENKLAETFAFHAPWAFHLHFTKIKRHIQM